MAFQVTKAKREKLHSVIALMGASGAGKTLSSLLIGYGMMKAKYPKKDDDFLWSKIGVIDTEHKRSLIYADMEHAGIPIKEFLHIDFLPPFTPKRYKQAVESMKKEGAEVVVVDSLSHAWEGEGGLLEMQQAAGGTFQAWSKIKPDIQDFIKTITQSDIHFIGTMRTKIEYAAEQSETGKLQIRKLGTRAIMKDDLEYEFQIVFNVDEEHNARATKDNSGIFEGRNFKITTEVGEKIFEWLEKGIDVQAQQRQQRDELVQQIRTYQKNNELEKLDKYISDLEKKANTVLENFSLTFVEKAIKLVENKVLELGGSLENEVKSK